MSLVRTGTIDGREFGERLEEDGAVLVCAACLQESADSAAFAAHSCELGPGELLALNVDPALVGDLASVVDPGAGVGVPLNPEPTPLPRKRGTSSPPASA